jgi:hypothetical protein
MSQISITSQVNNVPYAKQLGLPPFYYRKRSCDTNLTGSSPATQYQRLKQIQNTVRVYASLYTANLAPLTAYKKPISDPKAGFYGVCWNQMSDRPVPSVQKATIPTGYQTAMNRRHTSVTSSKPGSQTPGGVGCDIKHNSYDRYLNRLKGRGPMRRGVVPPTFGLPRPFNRAFPVYGDKVTKTSIVGKNCNCPIGSPNLTNQQNSIIYNNNPFYPNSYFGDYPQSQITYKIGDFVYAIQPGQTFYTRGTITGIPTVNVPTYTVAFDESKQGFQYNLDQLLVYVPCNCNATQNSTIFRNGLFATVGVNYNQLCQTQPF